MTLHYNNSNINYTIFGKGNTIVLLHGFTESLDIWNDFEKKLSEKYHIICIDLPGHGKSDCIGDIHTMNAMADVVKAVLDANQIRSSVMIGHSMGGYVTLAFAEKYPHTLKGFGLFHSTSLPDTEEGKTNRTRVIEIIRQNHHSFLSSFIPDLFAPENRALFQEEIENLICTANNMTKEGVIAAQEGMKIRPDRLHVLLNANVPVMFIAGQKDSRIPFAKITEQISLPAEAHVLLLRDVAHMGYIEAKDETYTFILNFADSIFSKNT